MPDFWIHILGGEFVLNSLKDLDWKRMLEDNRKTFNLGCQGPDMFFYNDFLPCIRNKRGPKIGTIMHEKHTKTLFLESIDYLKKNQHRTDFMTLATYFSGFIVHYAIDKNEHPFINARTKNFYEHKLLEMKLDTYFIKKYWDKKVHLISPSSKINIGKKLPSSIIEYYKNIVSRVFNINLEASTINDSYRDYKKVFNIFYSPKNYKRFWLNMLNTFIPMDISIFIYPTDVDNKILTNDEFLEFKSILMKGASEGVKLIELAAAYLKDEIKKAAVESAFHDISFSGKPISG
ncbi:zinc dependent phospholipase C family protein [Paramaledivibacter caminithermalis]|jgi:hypothetical protein|uniref:Zinc dependent phospholipase C n=1 Tax=Paramaledivibacter caminithermalis (strain DSM 15212 / CIP 107654 / DViRD3) TaxID=1121301 RepID=A0A1M6KKP2_PARC5|nr:zinc dependent phospholipase C family protein [Paramaledivibacter caminithermalis]SHJ59499.1 Zinc dependent phospholipase C [Paramaledivibacter caminithermalis DSM 15212]